MRVTHSEVTTSNACVRTIKRRNKSMGIIREVISGGDSASQFKEELKTLDKDGREELLRSAGFTLDIPAEQGLAMKADLGLPWNKLRIIRRQENK
jgi:hypothetical protein